MGAAEILMTYRSKFNCYLCCASAPLSWNITTNWFRAGSFDLETSLGCFAYSRILWYFTSFLQRFPLGIIWCLESLTWDPSPVISGTVCDNQLLTQTFLSLVPFPVLKIHAIQSTLQWKLWSWTFTNSFGAEEEFYRIGKEVVIVANENTGVGVARRHVVRPVASLPIAPREPFIRS